MSPTGKNALSAAYAACFAEPSRRGKPACGSRRVAFQAVIHGLSAVPDAPVHDVPGVLPDGPVHDDPDVLPDGPVHDVPDVLPDGPVHDVPAWTPFGLFHCVPD